MFLIFKQDENADFSMIFNSELFEKVTLERKKHFLKALEPIV